jgi:hypothetical protein
MRIVALRRYDIKSEQIATGFELRRRAALQCDHRPLSIERDNFDVA